jgi:deoxycytidylate deaminase
MEMSALPVNLSHQKYIDIAKEQAVKSVVRFKHGACIVKKNKVIGVGFNLSSYCLGTNWAEHIRFSGVHAELSAILNSPKHSLKDSVLYVVRINDKGDLHNSKPCEKCMNNIRKYKIRIAYYSSG